MAETIKGINVVIGAETAGLSAALSDVNKRSKDLQSELKQVDKLLKLDPTNTDIVAQKQKLLGDAVSNTTDKLARLKAAQEQVNKQFASGDITEGQYRAFQREVAATEQQLSKLTKSLNDQEKAVSKLGQDYRESFDQAQKSMGNTFESSKRVGAGITAVGAGLAFALGGAVNSAREFEQEMSNVNAVMDPEDVKQYSGALSDLAIKMGADTKYSATEAAQGIEELVKAGVKTTDIINGGLSGALSLATAGDLSLADAAEIASTALNAFKDDALSVSRAADILAGAANASATDVGELKFGLSAVASVASGMGLSFEDTATTLALFAQNGLKGSDAGTSLKTMLMNLQPHTKAQNREFEDLGLLTFDAAKGYDFLVKNGITPYSKSVDAVGDSLRQYILQQSGAKKWTKEMDDELDKLEKASGFVSSAFYDQSGNMKSMSDIAGILQNSLKDMNAEQRAAALQTLFGSDAIRAGNILYKEGAKGIDNMNVAINKIKASDVAAAKLDNLNGTIEQLNGSIDTAKVSIGNALLPALKGITKIIQSVVDGFNDLSPGMQSAIAISAAVAAALALIIGPLLVLIGFIPAIVAGFTALGVVFGVLLGPVGLIIAAIAALAAAAFLIIKNWGPISKFFTDLWDGIWGYLKGVWESITSGITSAFDKMLDLIRPILDGYKKVFSGVWDVIKNIFAGALLLIIDLVTGNFGKLKTDAAAIWSNLKDALAKIWDGIGQVFSGALDLLKRAFGAAWDAIKSVADSVWTAIRDGIQRAIDWIKGLPGTMADLGKNMIQGLVDGIKDKIGAVGDAIKGVTDKVTGGIRGALGIHSPSRVLMQLGQYTGQGFAQGIGNAIGDVKRQTAAMAAAAQTELAGGSTSVAASSSGSTAAAPASVGPLTVNVPVYLDGKEVARAVSQPLNGMQQSAARRVGLA